MLAVRTQISGDKELLWKPLYRIEIRLVLAGKWDLPTVFLVCGQSQTK